MPQGADLIYNRSFKNTGLKIAESDLAAVAVR
jgi:hypothetical protein